MQMQKPAKKKTAIPCNMPETTNAINTYLLNATDIKDVFRGCTWYAYFLRNGTNSKFHDSMIVATLRDVYDVANNKGLLSTYEGDFDDSRFSEFMTNHHKTWQGKIKRGVEVIHPFIKIFKHFVGTKDDPRAIETALVEQKNAVKRLPHSEATNNKETEQFSYNSLLESIIQHKQNAIRASKINEATDLITLKKTNITKTPSVFHIVVELISRLPKDWRQGIKHSTSMTLKEVIDIVTGGKRWAHLARDYHILRDDLRQLSVATNLYNPVNDSWDSIATAYSIPDKYEPDKEVQFFLYIPPPKKNRIDIAVPESLPLKSNSIHEQHVLYFIASYFGRCGENGMGRTKYVRCGDRLSESKMKELNLTANDYVEHPMINAVTKLSMHEIMVLMAQDNYDKQKKSDYKAVLKRLHDANEIHLDVVGKHGRDEVYRIFAPRQPDVLNKTAKYVEDDNLKRVIKDAMFRRKG